MWTHARLLVTAGAIALLVLLVGWALRRSLGRLARGREEAPYRLMAVLIEATWRLPVLATAIFLGSLALPLPAAAHSVLRDALVLAWLLQAGIWGDRAVRYGTDHLGTRFLPHADVGTAYAAGFLLRIFFYLALVLLALENLGVSVTTLVAGLGVGGIAIGLALQRIFGDLFSSLAILLDKPFVVGDFIVIDTFSGTVEKIGIKTTRLRSIDGEELVLPNADLVQGRIHNYKRMQERRVLFTLGITYETAIETLRGIPGLLRSIIEEEPGTRFERANFKGFGPSSLDFEIVYHILSADYNAYMDTQEAINLHILERFAQSGIAFAYPTQTLYLSRPGG